MIMYDDGLWEFMRHIQDNEVLEESEREEKIQEILESLDLSDEEKEESIRKILDEEY